ncbi:MAG: hypothetical protein DLM65_08020 [Candidatus Aeolococcus gillhamiae]|uniref:Uncharacterized protein n=1 Tax=Candidatus Aeolococcus gillhamiae TaxID=3127015 RepID=A0A2W5Z579_9BACT|nr:MAG: hypothetical protein DLM65_08020 [Candidatus Dormibacter sp. RRmetagenome_bin12]
MTPNQIVAHNVARARELRRWTQEQAADALAPYLGARLSGPSFSALERSAWTPGRVKQFSADDLLALSRGFDLPVGYFLTPPSPEFDAGLHAPDAGVNGLDPIVLLDAVLGTPENLVHWEAKLRAYSASIAPMPKSKRRKPNVSPADLADRLGSALGSRGQSVLRQCVGEVDDAADVLERMAEVLRAWDQTAASATADKAVPGDTRSTVAMTSPRHDDDQGVPR